MPLKFVLVILDGFGLREAKEGNAYHLAHHQTFDRLYATCPWAVLEASGSAVGLPDGVMGNSEVGHTTIGAGAVLEHHLVRINKVIASGSFGKNPAIAAMLQRVKNAGSALHLIGLVSEGGVHSHLNHLLALIRLAAQENIARVRLHAITDGRDSSPTSGAGLLESALKGMASAGIGNLATVIGRYHAMDRDRRWERTEFAYRAIVDRVGEFENDAVGAVRRSYQTGVTDEFIRPFLFRAGNEEIRMGKGDEVFFFNFRPDRMRQIVRAIGDSNFSEFARHNPPLPLCTTMTRYDDAFPYPVAFEEEPMGTVLGEVLEQAGFRQLRIAETEKYAHVTYFLNGGREEPFPNEERILVPSPKVATYDLQPEMSSYEIRDRAVAAIREGSHDCIIINLASPDMVGHTGNLRATIRAVEAADRVVGEVVAETEKTGAATFVTADHGNQEMMIHPDSGDIHTAHTINPVPFLLASAGAKMTLRQTGGLSDVAPTILDYLSLPIPSSMTGRSLLIRQ